MSHVKTFGPPSEANARRVTDSLLPIDSYENRDGYATNFLGADKSLELPGAGTWEGDLVPLKEAAAVDGSDLFELKYTHFSVKLAKSRSLPLFSACNINGKLSNRDIGRTDVWRRDPRVDNIFQNLREGYGNQHEGFFSRGHMTRREDPNWGDDDTAARSDADTFHITNVAPQRQGFNAGIWLDLENYVLDNTDDHDLRVTVVTGPILSEDDPVYYNRNIPTAFWKILAFVNARTRRLTTIGYKRSQLTYLPKKNRATFVFGDFDDTQVSIASLQEETGLDLSMYAAHDVMAGAGTGFEVKLSNVSDFYLDR